MSTDRHFEVIGVKAAQNFLESILSSTEQAEACRAFLGMLDALSGHDDMSKAARRGASVALVNVLEMGLRAIHNDGGR